jgi:PIN domain nuclease of toxin-antitoxin system
VLGDQKLSVAAKSHIELDGAEILISPASFWEIAIKVSLGKYTLNVPFEEFWKQGIEGNGFQVLPIEVRHTAALINLPFHRRDPFDRLLVAQAIVEDVGIISADGALDAYSIRRVW